MERHSLLFVELKTHGRLLSLKCSPDLLRTLIKILLPYFYSVFKGKIWLPSLPFWILACNLLMLYPKHSNRISSFTLIFPLGRNLWNPKSFFRTPKASSTWMDQFLNGYRLIPIRNCIILSIFFLSPNVSFTIQNTDFLGRMIRHKLNRLKQL